MDVTQKEKMATFINRTEAAEMLSVGPNTITTWCNDGTLVEGKHWSRISNRLYFNRRQIELLLPGTAEVEA